MGVLGKDLFDIHRPATHVKVLFGEHGYWIEDNAARYPYGCVLTELLDFDGGDYYEKLNAFEKSVKGNDRMKAICALRELACAFSKLPFYRLFLSSALPQRFEPLLLEATAGDADERQAELLFSDADEVARKYRQAAEDIRLIQTRYVWFLDELFRDAKPEKKKGQRKKPLAEQVCLAALEAFVSGVSLGQSSQVDAPQVNIQYMIMTPEGGVPELVEKLYFDRLADFVYVELMKGLQRGFVPKRCLNCGRWFLQEPGLTYSYCERPAPGEPDKRCRDVGSRASFQTKIRNNDVWIVHQRAYKKYFARTRKGTMSRSDFEVWAREAEALRDEALEAFRAAGTKEQRDALVASLKETLNRP